MSLPWNSRLVMVITEIIIKETREISFTYFPEKVNDSLVFTQTYNYYYLYNSNC